MTVNDYLPVEGETQLKYAGNNIRIYTEYCDTDNIDILFSEFEQINSNNNFTKPYWYLGNWHYNGFRNKIKSYINDGVPVPDELSRIYGNYFVVRLIFNTTDCVKIETLNCDFKIR